MKAEALSSPRRYGECMVGHTPDITFGQRVEQAGLSYSELAEEMNRKLEELTGRRGTFSDRTVYDLVHGKTSRPHARTCLALEAVFGCTTDQLGFTAPASFRSALTSEDPVRRRTFITAGPTAAAAAAIPSLATRHTIGLSDVERMRVGLTTLDELDDSKGGHAALEHAAVAGAQQVIELQQSGAASERVRRLLFAVAADFTAVAAWSCIDARESERAGRHLDRCATLAGLAQDSTAQLRVWNSMAILANQQGRHGDAVAAGRAAQRTGIARRDPMFGSMAHARTAVGLANLGDRQGSLRSLGLASDALGRASNQPRPTWMAFYGRRSCKRWRRSPGTSSAMPQRPSGHRTRRCRCCRHSSAATER